MHPYIQMFILGHFCLFGFEKQKMIIIINGHFPVFLFIFFFPLLLFVFRLSGIVNFYNYSEITILQLCPLEDSVYLNMKNQAMNKYTRKFFSCPVSGCLFCSLYEPRKSWSRNIKRYIIHNV